MATVTAPAPSSPQFAEQTTVPAGDTYIHPIPLRTQRVSVLVAEADAEVSITNSPAGEASPLWVDATLTDGQVGVLFPISAVRIVATTETAACIRGA